MRWAHLLTLSGPLGCSSMVSLALSVSCTGLCVASVFVWCVVIVKRRMRKGRIVADVCVVNRLVKTLFLRVGCVCVVNCAHEQESHMWCYPCSAIEQKILHFTCMWDSGWDHLCVLVEDDCDLICGIDLYIQLPRMSRSEKRTFQKRLYRWYSSEFLPRSNVLYLYLLRMCRNVQRR